MIFSILRQGLRVLGRLARLKNVDRHMLKQNHVIKFKLGTQCKTQRSDKSTVWEIKSTLLLGLSLVIGDFVNSPLFPIVIFPYCTFSILIGFVDYEQFDVRRNFQTKCRSLERKVQRITFRI